ncbi:MAG: hypothetical protein E7632_08275 [Ruminococcaceae bacterium]|nr:hypothetical protein [Oscillospiraceae bacterium]
MKTNATKLLSLFLALVMASGLAACGGEAVSSDTTAPNASGETTAQTTGELAPEEINRENAVLRMKPVDLQGETFNILYVGDKTIYRQDVYAEETGDIVDDAVFARNLYIEELLNCTFNPIAFDSDTQKTVNHIYQTVMAGEDLYDLCSSHQSYLSQKITQDAFHNFIDDPYIDWEMPWWNLDYMKELTVGDEKLFFLFGDISLMRMKSLGSVYFHRDLYDQLYGDPDELYRTVFDGKWTFDKYSELVRGAYADLNGNTVVDTGDRFGAFGNVTKSIEHYQYACDVYSTVRNEDGIPELALNNEKSVNFAEKLLDLYYNNEGFIRDPKTNMEQHQSEFMSGLMLFCPIWFREAEALREMTADYGIVNYPKYAEDEEYQALVHNGTTVFCTPITSKKTDKIGAICEVMAFYNYQNVTPAYFEVALKVKYSRDDNTSKVLDIISESAYTNFGYAYATYLAGLGYMRGMVESNREFASWYASKEAAAITGIQKIIDLYTAS